MVKTILTNRLHVMSGGFKGEILVMAEIEDGWWRNGEVNLARYPEVNTAGYMADMPVATARQYSREYAGALSCI